MRKIVIAAICVCFLTVLLWIVFLEAGIPFVARQQRWAIGIYRGSDPFHLAPVDNGNNPAITYQEVNDRVANFVADPFMLKEKDAWYMFFEVMQRDIAHADIGLAKSLDGISWEYQQIVLDEPFHLSYPYVFKWQDDYYMIPSCYQTHSVRLYQAVDFPQQWKLLAVLLKGDDYVDPSIFRYQDKWWLFHSSTKNNILNLYWADQLCGPWMRHPQSPVVEQNANIARPSGRILQFNGRIFRFTQDDTPTYGNQVRAFEITKLNESEYAERQVGAGPILQASGNGWNKNGMHHIDAHQIADEEWIACVDGYTGYVAFGTQY